MIKLLLIVFTFVSMTYGVIASGKMDDFEAQMKEKASAKLRIKQKAAAEKAKGGLIGTPFRRLNSVSVHRSTLLLPILSLVAQPIEIQRVDS